MRASFYSTSKIISQFYIQQNHSAENHFVISQKLVINLKRIKMKKLFFTAIALVAFSGVSMGSTLANNEIRKGTEKPESILKVLNRCQTVCHLAYNLAISEGASHEAADAYADMCYANCIKSISIEP